MTNEKLNSCRRWNIAGKLNFDDYYCTRSLFSWAEYGQELGYLDPRRFKWGYQRKNCGGCNKCEEIAERKNLSMPSNEYWKRKAYDMSTRYKTQLEENVKLKAENRMLFDIIKAGGDETHHNVSEGNDHIHRDHIAFYSSIYPKRDKE